MAAETLEFVESTRKMPLMSLAVRTSVVQLAAARVLVAPGSTLDEAQLRSTGEVNVIVAPNLLHAEGCALATRIFPAARLWGPPGIREKAPALSWHGILGDDEWPYDEELALLSLDGLPRLCEFELVHRATRTLLSCDLVFNIHGSRGLGARIVLGLFGTYERFAVSRMFTMMAKDRSAFTASVKRILEHDFDRIAPAHGDVVERGGKELLRVALRERGIDV